VHPATRFKPPVANCFAIDRSKAVTPKVIICVVCGLFFEFDIPITHALFPTLLFDFVERLCFLSVAIPDMHISHVLSKV
jgi:hypothetical protein